MIRSFHIWLLFIRYNSKDEKVPWGSSWQRCGRSGSILCSSCSSAARPPSSSELCSRQSAPQLRWTSGWWSKGSPQPGQSPPSSVLPLHPPVRSTGRALLLLALTGSSGAGLSLEDVTKTFRKISKRLPPDINDRSSFHETSSRTNLSAGISPIIYVSCNRHPVYLTLYLFVWHYIKATKNMGLWENERDLGNSARLSNVKMNAVTSGQLDACSYETVQSILPQRYTNLTGYLTFLVFYVLLFNLTCKVYLEKHSINKLYYNDKLSLLWWIKKHSFSSLMILNSC